MMNQFESYSGAVVRLATFQRKNGEPGALLFATVSLLASGRPRPPPMKTLDWMRVGAGRVHFRRVVMDASSAVAWYRALARGENATPVPSQQEDVLTNIDGLPMIVSDLDDDPAWPNLGLPMGDGFFAQPSGRDHPAPFLGSLPCRLHRRFGVGEGFEAVLADKDAVDFLARRLHIDLRSYPEYLGSVALAVPDPIIQRVENIMLPPSREGQQGERILYRFVPRPGQSLEKIQITTFDEQTHLLTAFESRSVPADGVLVVDKGACVGMYGYVVTHSDHGVLMYHPPTPFLRQVSFNMSMASSSQTNIDVPTGDSPSSPRIVYQAGNRSNVGSTRTMGEESPHAGIIRRVGSASAERLRSSRAFEAGQRWFSRGTREDAMRFIQRTIGSARSRVMIADPYFGGLQIGQFLYAVPAQAKFVLVTSSLAFKATKSRTREEAIAQFRSMLIDLRKLSGASPIVSVVESSQLHDRFLVIDEVAWFVGSSLNSLGNSGSMIVKLPDPYDVIARLEEFAGDSRSFDAFAEDHSSKNMDKE